MFGWGGGLKGAREREIDRDTLSPSSLLKKNKTQPPQHKRPPQKSYFYISIAYNVCYTLALMGLVLFWNGASELLAPFNPLLKFLVVKTVVFLTFWQGMAVSFYSARGDASGPEEGKAVQNFLILAEMVLAAVGMLYGFPHAEYSYGGAARGFRVAAFAHAVSVRDVVADVAHSVR